MGQQQYTDQGSAEASTWDELDLAGFPVVEFRPLYKIVFQTANAYANTPKTKFVNLLDLRQIIASGAGGSSTAVSDHGSLTGLLDDDHTQYLLADGTRTAASLTVSGAITASSLILDGIEIDAATPSDTNVLKYDAGLNKYVPGVASTVASLDDLTDVIISAATPNQVLKYDGTNWVNSVSPSSVEGTTHFSTIGNGSDSTFTITHGLSTRDVVVSFTETTSPYASFSTLWEATTLNAITVYFEVPPSANSVRVSIYAAVSGVAITTDLDSLNDVSLSGLANGDFLRYNGSTWINDPVNLSTDTIGDYVSSLVAGTGIQIDNNSGEGTTPTISILAELNDLTNVNVLSATPNQFLQFDGSNWINTDIPQINEIGDIGNVQTISSYIYDTLQYNGTNWVNNSDISLIGNIYFKEELTGPTYVTSGTISVHPSGQGLYIDQTTFLNALKVNNIQIDPTGATIGQALLFDGTNFVADTVIATADTRDIEVRLAMNVE